MTGRSYTFRLQHRSHCIKKATDASLHYGALASGKGVHPRRLPVNAIIALYDELLSKPIGLWFSNVADGVIHGATIAACMRGCLSADFGKAFQVFVRRLHGACTAFRKVQENTVRAG